MCIIIAKDKDDRLPTIEELRTSFEYNNDGGGFMYVDNGKVVIDKGYMEWRNFIKHYKKLIKKYNNFKNKCLVIHCRIGTSGQNIAGNTHPYPISNDIHKLRKKFLKEDIGIVHNGIISNYGGIDAKYDMNDTQDFITNYLRPIYSHYKNFYRNKYILDGIKEITSSKFVILNNNDEIYKIGDFIEDNNLSFSNSTYVSYKSYSKSYSNYDDSYYDYFPEDQNYDYREYYILPLEKEWFLDKFGNGDYELVGDNDYYLDLYNYDLLEKKGDDYDLVARNVMVYDENFLEVV